MSDISHQAIEALEGVIDEKIRKALGRSESTKSQHRAYVLNTDGQNVIYVSIPGMADNIPVDISLADAEKNDLVHVTIDDGVVILDGNESKPAANQDTVNNVINESIGAIGESVSAYLLGGNGSLNLDFLKAIVAELDYADIANAVVGNARISNLLAEKADINLANIDYANVDSADIDRLIADTASITGKADIALANIDYANVDVADINRLLAGTAVVTDLQAATGRISTIESNYVSTNYLTSNYIDAQHINADYAEIDFANVINQQSALEIVQQLMATSGWFNEITTQSGTITGELTAVKIDADDVEIDNLKVSNLYLLNDEDGLYYALNVTLGGTTPVQYEALSPTEQEKLKSGLHGKNIIAGSITADKITVTDLNAFRATIAGMVFGTMTLDGIEYKTLHSAGKTAVNTDSPGMYTDSMGQFSVGNGSNYLMFYKDTNNQWQLAISAKQITFDGTTLASRIQTLQDQIDSTVETWFGSGAPTSSTAPEVNWTGQGEKAKHLGDVYYDNDTGYAYRFVLLNDTYGWTVLPDSAVATALDTANSILIYDHTYEIVQSDGTVQGETAREDVAVFTAHLYQGGVDVAGQQPDYPASQFTWYRKSETPDQNGDTEHYIDSGLTLRVRMEELGYGSHIIGKFTTLEQAALLTDEDEPLTTSDDEPLIVRTPLGDSVRVSDLSVETTLYGTEKIMIVGAGGEHLVTVSTLQEYLDANLTKQIRFGTTSQWAAQTSLVSEAETVYVYTDHSQDQYGNALAGLKVGDGSAYVVDLPFVDAVYAEHVADTDVHVTSQEKAFWNNKVRCYYAGVEQLVFTTN